MTGFAAALVLGYGPFSFLRLPLLYPLQAEGQAKTASDLPFLVEALVGLGMPGWSSSIVLLLVLGGVLLAAKLALPGAGRRERLRISMSGCTALTLALLLLSKKSWPPYLMLILFPLCLVVADEQFNPGRLLAFAAFSWVAILAHSVWATEFLQIEGPALHSYLVGGQARSLAFLLLQAALVGGYLWLLLLALRQIGMPHLWRRSNPGPNPLVPSCAR